MLAKTRTPGQFSYNKDLELYITNFEARLQSWTLFITTLSLLLYEPLMVDERRRKILQVKES